MHVMYVSVHIRTFKFGCDIFEFWGICGGGRTCRRFRYGGLNSCRPGIGFGIARRKMVPLEGKVHFAHLIFVSTTPSKMVSRKGCRSVEKRPEFRIRMGTEQVASRIRTIKPRDILSARFWPTCPPTRLPRGRPTRSFAKSSSWHRPNNSDRSEIVPSFGWNHRRLAAPSTKSRLAFARQSGIFSMIVLPQRE